MMSYYRYMELIIITVDFKSLQVKMGIQNQLHTNLDETLKHINPIDIFNNYFNRKIKSRIIEKIYSGFYELCYKIHSQTMVPFLLIIQYFLSTKFQGIFAISKDNFFYILWEIQVIK